MANGTLYECQVLPATQTPFPLKMQYAKLRYDCFQKDDPNLVLDHENGAELDCFDEQSTTLYIMITARNKKNQEPQLICAVRLLPTLQSYELEQPSYKYLTQGTGLPKSAHIFESSRWVGRSSRTTAGKIAGGLLIMELARTARELGAHQLIGVITTTTEEFIEKRNSEAKRASAAVKTERDVDKIMITKIDIDDKFYEMGKTMFDSALNETSVINIEVSDDQVA